MSKVTNSRWPAAVILNFGRYIGFWSFFFIPIWLSTILCKFCCFYPKMQDRYATPPHYIALWVCGSQVVLYAVLPQLFYIKTVRGDTVF